MGYYSLKKYYPKFTTHGVTSVSHLKTTKGITRILEKLIETTRAFEHDRLIIFESAKDFAESAWHALHKGTGLDPDEGSLRPGLRVTFGSHPHSDTIGVPPELRAMLRDPVYSKREAREIVDEFYRRLPGNDLPSSPDTLGSYWMAPATGCIITLKWDTLRLASIELAKAKRWTEADALAALTRYVYLHELAHYFTHWGKRDDKNEKEWEESWRDNYMKAKSEGALHLKEGITELACETALEGKPEEPWRATREAMQWLNGSLVGILKSRYVVSKKKILGFWKAPQFPGTKTDNFWRRMEAAYYPPNESTESGTVTILGVTFGLWKRAFSDLSVANPQICWQDLCKKAKCYSDDYINAKRIEEIGTEVTGVDLSGLS